ncbi:MAG: NAD(P)H-hydrate dehydratase [Candidatus Heimdallarchaeota archaeon]|nr:NAD(P)H-hydrate dehydratase [Candidatus Heimdallarchaeota archaeon]
MKVSTVEEMRALDQKAIEMGISQELLMENAGEATYFVILKEFGVQNKKFVVFSGPGNNGGDGFVVARKICSSGGKVKIYLLSSKEKYKGSAKMNVELISKYPIEIEQVTKDNLHSIPTELHKADAIVDAIFGTGITRPVEGRYKKVIQFINESNKIVFSVDIPSGINGNTGQEMGIAVNADYTTTFGLPKIGNLLYPGFEKGGKLYVTHISFPPENYQDSLKMEITTPIELPKRLAWGHKGTFGKALFIAGAGNYYGAPYYSAMSFLKAGGGLAYLACPKSVAPFIASKGSEIVFQPLEETGSKSISLESKDELIELSKDVKIVVMGPGLSLNEETQELVRVLTKKLETPLLIDGDGITALAKDLQVIRDRKAETILTPHVGEMSRITNKSIEEINKNKVAILQQAVKDLHSIIILKGAHSLIGYPDERIFINPSGNSGMATAGSGDSLTGAIAAMVGIGLPLEEAVRMGVFIHGFSGDLAAKEKGKDGITAQDILDYLPLAMKNYRENVERLKETYYETVYLV